MKKVDLKEVQQWCKEMTKGYRDVDVRNMTTSWRDGLAFCAIIHRFKPDLIDYDSLSKENVFENNDLAYKVARKEFEIPELLDAQDMVKMRVPDRLSVITYVLQYYNYFHDKPQNDGPGVNIFDRTKKEEGVIVKADDRSPDLAAATGFLQINNDRQESTVDKCLICKEKIYLLEKLIDNGKLYHRRCFQRSDLSQIPTLYKRQPISVLEDKSYDLPSKKLRKPVDETSKESRKPEMPSRKISKTGPSKSYAAHFSESTDSIPSSSSLNQQFIKMEGDKSSLSNAHKPTPKPRRTGAVVESSVKPAPSKKDEAGHAQSHNDGSHVASETKATMKTDKSPISASSNLCARDETESKLFVTKGGGTRNKIGPTTDVTRNTDQVTDVKKVADKAVLKNTDNITEWKRQLEQRKKEASGQKAVDTLGERSVSGKDIPSWQVEARRRIEARKGGYDDPEKNKINTTTKSAMKPVARGEITKAKKCKLRLDEILKELGKTDVRQTRLEWKSRALEDSVRNAKDEETEDNLMIDWLKLVNEKNELVRMERNLVHEYNDLELQLKQEQIEEHLWELEDKPNKTGGDEIAEKKLIEEKAQIVYQRNQIVDNIEEERLKYENEDSEIQALMEHQGKEKSKGKTKKGKAKK